MPTKPTETKREAPVPFPNQWREKPVANPDRPAGEMTKAENAAVQLIAAFISKKGKVAAKDVRAAKKLAREILNG